jgi:hypothetical protein
MVTIKIERIETLGNGYRVDWSVDNEKKLFDVKPLEISYDCRISPDRFYPTDNLLALTLPILAKECGAVRIVSPVDLGESTRSYWDRVIRALNVDSFHLKWETTGSSSAQAFGARPACSQSGRIALLFGGGIESVFALSVLYPLKPVLISIFGEQWMNNDFGRSPIKRLLENRLASEFNLELQRISSNALSLIQKDEVYKNYYVSGLLFYWHSLPLCKQFGVHTLYKASEMEEALNFDYQDLSLHPSFLRNTTMDGEPLYLPLFNCYPKIQMMGELAKTPFLRFIYSCYHNSDKRWCGECTKCYRISEFCERLGIDRNVIGMQAGIIGHRETGSISRHYWDLADQLYGKRRIRELSQSISFNGRRWKQRAANALRRLVNATS